MFRVVVYVDMAPMVRDSPHRLFRAPVDYGVVQGGCDSEGRTGTVFAKGPAFDHDGAETTPIRIHVAGGGAVVGVDVLCAGPGVMGDFGPGVLSRVLDRRQFTKTSRGSKTRPRSVSRDTSHHCDVACMFPHRSVRGIIDGIVHHVRMRRRRSSRRFRFPGIQTRRARSVLSVHGRVAVRRSVYVTAVCVFGHMGRFQEFAGCGMDRVGVFSDDGGVHDMEIVLAPEVLRRRYDVTGFLVTTHFPLLYKITSNRG